MISRKKQLNQYGFSIIEVVVTLFIIGVTLVLYQATSNAVVINKYGRYKEVALRIADKEMQTLRTTAFATLPVSGSFSDPLLSSLPSGAGTIAVTDESATLKRVVVTVTWRNPSHTGNQQIQLSTFIAQGGLGQ